MAAPSAYLSHAVPGRSRWRIPAKKADGAFFSELERRLAALPEVLQAEGHPLTASILVRHHGDTAALARHAESEDLFAQREPERSCTSMRDALTDRFGRIERWMSDKTGGRLDPPMALSLLLTGLALTQVLRGRVAAPAVTLAWYALNSLLIARSITPSHRSETTQGNGSSRR